MSDKPEAPRKLDKIPEPEEMNGERYFQIRDVGSDGCGSFESFCVDKDCTQEEICAIACEVHTQAMIKKEQFHIPSFFRKPPVWRNSLKVVEQKRDITPPNEWHIKRGKTYGNAWGVKRGGFKFKITRDYIQVKYADGTTKKIQGYRPNFVRQEKPE